MGPRRVARTGRRGGRRASGGREGWEPSVYGAGEAPGASMTPKSGTSTPY